MPNHMDTNCVFCRIAAGTLQAKTVYQSDHVVAFWDIRPIAPVHILIVPKRHVVSLNDFSDPDIDEMGHLLLAAREVAKQTTFVVSGEQKTVAETGYKLLLRTGKYGGQEVDHVHFHLLGGAYLREGIMPL